MPTYDKAFDPPAPMAKVTIRNTANGTSVPDVPMLIDTGADVTLIPLAFINPLGVSINQNESYELMGFDGHTSFAQVVQLDVIFLKKTFRGRFLVTDQDHGILGRDVLRAYTKNQFAAEATSR